MPRKQKKIHYIYKTTCNVTNKYYIGMHSTNNIDDGYLGSGKRLWYSINKHGKDNHSKEILEYCENRKELKEREKEIVNEQLLTEDLCMNLTVGGEGGWSSEQQRENNKKSVEKQRILRETDPEWVKRVKENSSKAHKKAYEKGRKKVVPDWTGQKHSEETKKKMSETKKGKYDGENNPSFGTCWVTKDGGNKKIKKEDLESYTSDGWVRGRKIK